MAKVDKMQIVLVTMVETAEATGNWTTRRGDGINAMPELRTVLRPQACMWLRAGDVLDVAKAQTYAAQQGDNVSVYTFPSTERHPLEAAKSLAMAQSH